MVVKKKSKVTKTLITATFFIIIIAIVTPAMAAGSNRILVIAKGDDGDIAGATTSIIAMIEIDKASGIPSVAQVAFQTKIYDESGKKIYSMKGKLKDGLIMSTSFQFPCTIREVTWVNLWLVTGQGMIKTTDTELEIEYRRETIFLPNTKGEYVTATLMILINPKGEYVKGDDPAILIWPEGGWATAILMIGGIPTFGVVTYLTKDMEI